MRAVSAELNKVCSCFHTIQDVRLLLLQLGLRDRPGARVKLPACWIRYHGWLATIPRLGVLVAAGACDTISYHAKMLTQ